MGTRGGSLHWKTFRHQRMQNLLTALTFLTLGVTLSTQCEITLKNVGHVAFNWTLEYAGHLEHESSLEPDAHDNWTCLCLPHDMKIIYKDIYCYHYMNCLHNYQYEVEVTDYAIYIDVGHDNVKTCVI